MISLFIKSYTIKDKPVSEEFENITQFLFFHLKGFEQYLFATISVSAVGKCTWSILKPVLKISLREGEIIGQ
jgi:hypothetical protein